MADATFSKLSDDIVLKIFSPLEDDPRNWARLSCVCRKFSTLISTVCCKSKCLSSFPAISDDLVSLSSSPAFPGGWASLHKLAVCCPGLQQCGVLLDNSDFGLHRELGSDDNYHRLSSLEPAGTLIPASVAGTVEENFGGWSLYDDLYFDTIYNNDESIQNDSYTLASTPMDILASMGGRAEVVNHNNYSNNNLDAECMVANETRHKKRKVSLVKPLHNNNENNNNNNNMQRSHLAFGGRSLSREQGNKLLASRFRGDCLYLCDWPGCVHIEEKRNYMLFRGFFSNFKRSRVWRAIRDAKKNQTDINCAFCCCKETWDLHSAFCLRRGFGFHEDGEPVVRAYVCENGHVSGAWTDLPTYSGE